MERVTATDREAGIESDDAPLRDGEIPAVLERYVVPLGDVEAEAVMAASREAVNRVERDSGADRDIVPPAVADEDAEEENVPLRENSPEDVMDGLEEIESLFRPVLELSADDDTVDEMEDD